MIKLGYGLLQRIFLIGIRGYQRVISPLFPSSCRFYPTCSEYAIQAIQTYGLCRGIVLALKRIGHCHPFSPGGFDPIP
ncbi:MAG TPA: membrane protein insertion efficiency factor YidD [Thermodesulfobacteriota bacterium]|nr:membrane protein insertion efficiency factor YidD [Thermodesulfobacteriota bacterium]